MKRTFILEDLDCAHCAAKIEDGVKKIDGVIDAGVNFVMQRMTIEADERDFDDIMKRVVKVVKKIEPDCRVKL